MAQRTSDFVKLPMLALRGLHVFPGMLLTFDVERQASIAALNNAVRTDQMIFLSAQKDLTADMPEENEIYSVGTVCRIRQQLRQPRGNICRVMVEGVYRAEAESMQTDPNGYYAYVSRLDDKPERVNAARREAIMRSVLSRFEEYVQFNNDMINEQILNLLANPTPSYISYYIAQNARFSIEDRQAILEDEAALLRQSPSRGGNQHPLHRKGAHRGDTGGHEPQPAGLLPARGNEDHPVRARRGRRGRELP